MKNRGFTLTEILVTLVIIGIISAFTIPNITGILKNNRDYLSSTHKMTDNTLTKECFDYYLK